MRRGIGDWGLEGGGELLPRSRQSPTAVRFQPVRRAAAMADRRYPASLTSQGEINRRDRNTTFPQSQPVFAEGVCSHGLLRLGHLQRVRTDHPGLVHGNLRGLRWSRHTACISDWKNSPFGCHRYHSRGGTRRANGVRRIAVVGPSGDLCPLSGSNTPTGCSYDLWLFRSHVSNLACREMV